MKTVQEHLREADRERLLDNLFYTNVLKDEIALLENRDMAIGELEKRYKAAMSRVIDQLLAITPAADGNSILYLYDSADHSVKLEMVRLEELKENIDCDGYGLIGCDWEKSLGYLVSDNKLTQDNMDDLLAQFIHEITLYGLTQEKITARKEEINQMLEESLKSRGEGIPAREAFRRLAREFGWPEPEEDETQDDLRHAINEAKWNFELYGKRRERKRILEALQ